MSSKCCQEQVCCGFCALDSMQSFCFLFLAGEWPKKNFQSWYYSIETSVRCDGHWCAPINILHSCQCLWKGKNTHYHVIFCVFDFCFFSLRCFILSYAACRYNIYLRVGTLMKKVADKKVKLEATFLPKKKPVLNKRVLPVLNKPVKRRRPKVDSVLDSQCSISSIFVDSQARGPSC